MAKGYPVTQEAKDKIIKGKFETFKSSLDWNNIDPSLWDASMELSMRNRERKSITLSDFRKMINENKNMKQMIAEGISKHLLFFFSSLAQGKIKITKQQFADEYLSGISLDDISARHGIDRQNVTYLRELFGIKARGAKFLKRKTNDVPLTQRQKEIIYGSLMGDAGFMSSSSVKFKQGDDQKDYLVWKYREMESIASKNSLKSDISFDERFGHENTAWRFYTVANTEVETILNQFYDFGMLVPGKAKKKRITKEILDNLSPLSLAVWYMDDGSTDHGHRMGLKTTTKSTMSLCTDSFSMEEKETIMEWFFEKYRIKCEPSNHGSKVRIRIGFDDVENFVSLIRPHVLPMFHYKIDYSSWLQAKGENKNASISVARAEITRCPLGTNFKSLSPKEQDEWIWKIVAYNRKGGFDSLFEDDDDLEKDLNSIMSFNPESISSENETAFSSVGSKFPLRFFGHFWSAKHKGEMSPKEVFENDKYLSEIVRELVLEDRFPDGRLILGRIRGYRGNRSVSLFMPCMAKSIFNKYMREKGKVLDFCGGYGGRLAGALCCEKVLSYCGNDANFRSYEAMGELARFFRNHTGIQKETSFYNQDAVSFLNSFSDKSFDFCFTSPPYFDAEEYDDDQSQSSKKFESYGEWMDGFLLPSIVAATRVSKLVGINIANTGPYEIADDLRKIMSSKNMLIKEDAIKYPNYGKIRYESLFLVAS